MQIVDAGARSGCRLTWIRDSKLISVSDYVIQCPQGLFRNVDAFGHGIAVFEPVSGRRNHDHGILGQGVAHCRKSGKCRCSPGSANNPAKRASCTWASRVAASEIVSTRPHKVRVSADCSPEVCSPGSSAVRQIPTTTATRPPTTRWCGTSSPGSAIRHLSGETALPDARGSAPPPQRSPPRSVRSIRAE